MLDTETAEDKRGDGHTETNTGARASFPTPAGGRPRGASIRASLATERHERWSWVRRPALPDHPTPCGVMQPAAAAVPCRPRSIDPAVSELLLIAVTRCGHPSRGLLGCVLDVRPVAAIQKVAPAHLATMAPQLVASSRSMAPPPSSPSLRGPAWMSFCCLLDSTPHPPPPARPRPATVCPIPARGRVSRPALFAYSLFMRGLMEYLGPFVLRSGDQFVSASPLFEVCLVGQPFWHDVLVD